MTGEPATSTASDDDLRRLLARELKAEAARFTPAEDGLQPDSRAAEVPAVIPAVGRAPRGRGAVRLPGPVRGRGGPRVAFSPPGGSGRCRRGDSTTPATRNGRPGHPGCPRSPQRSRRGAAPRGLGPASGPLTSGSARPGCGSCWPWPPSCCSPGPPWRCPASGTRSGTSPRPPPGPAAGRRDGGTGGAGGNGSGQRITGGQGTSPGSESSGNVPATSPSPSASSTCAQATKTPTKPHTTPGPVRRHAAGSGGCADDAIVADANADPDVQQHADHSADDTDTGRPAPPEAHRQLEVSIRAAQ